MLLQYSVSVWLVTPEEGNNDQNTRESNENRKKAMPFPPAKHHQQHNNGYNPRELVAMRIINA